MRMATLTTPLALGPAPSFRSSDPGKWIIGGLRRQTWRSSRQRLSSVWLGPGMQKMPQCWSFCLECCLELELGSSWIEGEKGCCWLNFAPGSNPRAEGIFPAVLQPSCKKGFHIFGEELAISQLETVPVAFAPNPLSDWFFP